MMKIAVPEYVLAAILRHYGTLAGRCTVPRDDLKAVNAKRLAGEDLRRLRRILNVNDKEQR